MESEQKKPAKTTPEQIFSEFPLPDLGSITEEDFKRLIQQKITVFPHSDDDDEDEEEEVVDEFDEDDEVRRARLQILRKSS